MNSIVQQRDWRQALQWELNRYNWDYFGTGTFPKQITETEARTKVENYFWDLQKRLQNPLPRFWVLEPHRDRDVPHLHFLLAEAKSINEDVEQILWSYWRKISGKGRFQSREFESSGGGISYLMKYLTKDITDWDVKNLDKMSILHVENSLLGKEKLEEIMCDDLGLT